MITGGMHDFVNGSLLWNTITMEAMEHTFVDVRVCVSVCMRKGVYAKMYRISHTIIDSIVTVNITGTYVDCFYVPLVHCVLSFQSNHTFIDYVSSLLWDWFFLSFFFWWSLMLTLLSFDSLDNSQHRPLIFYCIIRLLLALQVVLDL